MCLVHLYPDDLILDNIARKLRKDGTGVVVKHTEIITVEKM